MGPAFPPVGSVRRAEGQKKAIGGLSAGLNLNDSVLFDPEWIYVSTKLRSKLDFLKNELNPNIALEVRLITLKRDLDLSQLGF